MTGQFSVSCLTIINFLLDAKGRVVARGLKGEALYKKIEEMTR